MATWNKIVFGAGGVVVVVAIVGGLWLRDLLSFDTSDEAGVLSDPVAFRVYS